MSQTINSPVTGAFKANPARNYRANLLKQSAEALRAEANNDVPQPAVPVHEQHQQVQQAPRQQPAQTQQPQKEVSAQAKQAIKQEEVHEVFSFDTPTKEFSVEEHPAYQQALQQAKKIEEDLEREKKERQEALEELKAARKKLDDYDKEKLLKTITDFDDIELSSIDPKELKAVLDRTTNNVLKTVEHRVQDKTASLEDRISELHKQLEETKSRSVTSKYKEVDKEILKRVPNIMQLQKTPEYAKLMNAPVRPGSSRTIGLELRDEYTAGNVEGVLEILSPLLSGTTGSLESIASVSSTPQSATVQQEEQEFQEVDEAAREAARIAFSNKKMSREEYQKVNAAYRETMNRKYNSMRS